MTQDELFASILLAIGHAPDAKWESSEQQTYYRKFMEYVQHALDAAGLKYLQLSTETRLSYFSRFVDWQNKYEPRT